jgi:hypothetical protein
MDEASGEYQSQFITKNYEPKRADEILIGRDNDENWERSLAHAVMNLHDGVGRTDAKGKPLPDTGIPPKILFVTATSAIPYASAIRECWRTAYPDEKSPKVFFVDVNSQRFGPDENSRRFLSDAEVEEINITDRLSDLGKRYDAFDNVAVFDEFENLGYTLSNVQKTLEHAGFSNINSMHGRWVHISTWPMSDETKPVIREGEQKAWGKPGTPYRRLKLQVTDESKKLTSDMRKIGRKMGEEIKKHLQPVVAV